MLSLTKDATVVEKGLTCMRFVAQHEAMFGAVLDDGGQPSHLHTPQVKDIVNGEERL